MPEIIATAAERDALPVETVVRSNSGTIACRFNATHCVLFGVADLFPWKALALPLTVLYRPNAKPACTKLTELCSYCGQEYPNPVELHHTEQECINPIENVCWLDLLRKIGLGLGLHEPLRTKMIEESYEYLRNDLEAHDAEVATKALEAMGEFFRMASQLGTGDRDEIAAQACFDRASGLRGVNSDG